MSRAAPVLLVLGSGLAWACGAKSGLAVPEECASYTSSASLAPLDVFIAMDTSGSMEAKTSAGIQKIAAVQQALAQFFTDPASAGIGVTLAFFPVVAPGVPQYCASDSECGTAGTCTPVSACVKAYTLCHSAADCPAGDACEAFGTCSNAGNFYCLLSDPKTCLSGVCNPVGLCSNHYTCSADKYAPVLPVGVLPGAAASLIEALGARVPEGGTPTLPALKASLDAAADHAQEAKGHKTIVLLATDGLPTLCDPAIDPFGLDYNAGIPKLSASAEAGAKNGIQTFVIGVFAPDEAADAEVNLGKISQAGGSGPAFVITTEQDVAEKFLSTLNQIRLEATQCEYVLPRPSGGTLDPTHLVVSISAANGVSIPLERRASAADCDPASGGFYLDTPVAPSRVVLCPASCNQTESGSRPLHIDLDCDRNAMVLP